MNNPSDTSESSSNKVGVLKKTLVAEWTVSPRQSSVARSDVFSSDAGLNSLTLVNESDLPENMMKFNVWFFTRATVEHTLEVSLSLLDDQNRQCYTVEKRLSNSTLETSKVCATVDFSIIPQPPNKFFHDGVLRIQCSICMDTPQCLSSSSKPSKEEFNKVEALLQKHLKNIEKAGTLDKKDVFTWVVPESILRRKLAEVGSDPFTYASSKFRLIKSKKRFEVCLIRNTPVFFQQKVRVTLAVLDNRGIVHYSKEKVTEDTGKISINYGEVLENRGKFIDKGKLKIYCSLQIDNSSKVPDVLSQKPGGSSVTSQLMTVSSPTEEVAEGQIDSSYLSRKRGLSPKLEAESSTFVSSISDDKSKIKKALNEMLQLLDEARVETVVIVYKKLNGTS